MYQVIIVIHVLLGLGVIGLVLMQQGKGADAGATFGGGASGSVFGAQGAASFLSRTTAILASLFFVTSLGLAWINSNRTGAAVDFMGTEAVEKEVPDLGLPNVDGAKQGVVVPPVNPVSVPATNVTSPTAVVPPVTPVTEQPVVAEKSEAPKTEEPKDNEEKVAVPKAEEVKQAEEPQKVEVHKKAHTKVKSK